MSIDKELYRRAYELHRQWNHAERVERAYNAGQRSPLECWKQYIAWWQFLMRISPEPSLAQRERRFQDWYSYYERIQKLEVWRKEHGNST
jgi:hypothetical protein